jgi:tyrosinase
MFSDTNFFTFSSQIEGTPHNSIHPWVGGIMGGGGSAGDPVFWTHHCMVDYCWAKWNLELENDNTNDSTWIDTSWDHFVDGSGDTVTVTAGITTLFPLLTYQYESSAIGSVPAKDVPTAGKDFEELKKRVEKGADVRFAIKRRIPIAEAADIAIEKPYSREAGVSAADFSLLLESEAARENIFASIEYAEAPPTNDYFVRVFVNLPNANERTSIEDPHYAGSFAFFGTRVEGGRGHAEAPSFLVDVTRTLRELRRRQELSPGAPLSIQLVAAPMSETFSRRDAVLRLRKVEMLVTPVTVRSKDK